MSRNLTRIAKPYDNVIDNYNKTLEVKKGLKLLIPGQQEAVSKDKKTKAKNESESKILMDILDRLSQIERRQKQIQEGKSFITKESIE